MLLADQVVARRAAGLELGVDRRLHRLQHRSVVADAMEQLDDERGERPARPVGRLVRRALLQARDVAIGGLPGVAHHQDLVGEAAQVLEQRQPQHARPGPQLADGQRRHGLVAGQEGDQLLAVEPAVAVTHELDGQRVGAHVADPVGGRQRRQLGVVAPRQVLAQRANLGEHQVVVVEHPLAGRRHVQPGAHVVGEQPVGLAEDAGVVLEPGEQPAAAAPRIDREARRQRPGVILQALDVEQLGTQRRLDRRCDGRRRARRTRSSSVTSAELGKRDPPRVCHRPTRVCGSGRPPGATDAAAKRMPRRPLAHALHFTDSTARHWPGVTHIGYEAGHYE